jgi:rhodanese-related sulfurtransferase
MTELGALGWHNVLSLMGNSFGGYAEGGFPVEPGLPAEAQALNGAIPDQALWTLVDETLAGIPEGWGAVKVDNLATELVENPDLILIDVRTPAEIEADGSIEAENALAIPLADLVAQRAQWPADKSAPIVVYCGSGHRSTIAMSILWTYGYENVRSMQGGFSTWLDAGYPRLGGAPDFDGAFNAFLADMVSFNTISLSDLNGMLAEEPPPFLLDVRTVAEVEENGHIEGSVLIPLVDLMKNLDKLPGFDTTIVAYCGSGWRCTIAMPALEALGWTNVLALKGGSFGGWAAEGYPVVEGLPLEAESLNAASLDPAMVAQLDAVFSGIPAGYGGIAPADLAAELAENPELILIDVRTPEEVAEVGVIEAETWIGIPLVEFINQMADWPADKDAQIVVYCGSGHRSTIAMSILWTYGFSDVRSMQGGVGAWLEAGYPVVELVAE